MTIKDTDDGSSSATAPSTTPNRNRSLMVGESNWKGVACHVQDEVTVTLDAPKPVKGEEEDETTDNPKSRLFDDIMHTTNGGSVCISHSNTGKINKNNDNDDVDDVIDDNNKDKNKRDETTWRTRLHAIRTLAGAIVNAPRFQAVIVLLIVVNSIMMGIATFDFVQNNPDVASGFEITDKVFLIIFTMELGLQFIYRDVRLFLDGWLLFDFIIVVMSWSLESLQVVRTFRVFRALRLVTRVKVLKNLVSALFSVGPRIFAIFCLLVLVFYIYAVMCTVLFKDLYAEGYTEFDYFSRLDQSLWTLLVMMTLEWGDVTREVMVVYSWAWAIFVSFVMITSFSAYNLIVAVVCDSVSIIEKQSKEDDHVDGSEGGMTIEELQFQQIRRLQTRVAELAKQQQQILQALLDATGDSGGFPDFDKPCFRSQEAE
ncbi:ion transport protein [Fragilaria crotonensis]|nr:ion transport protein [Fragilaria crotonensis]